MYLNRNRISVLVTCVIFLWPFCSHADELPQKNINAPCSYKVRRSVVTPYSIVTFMVEPNKSGPARWICVDDKLVLEVGIRDGRQSSFQDTHGDILTKGGEWVERLGKPIVLRMVIEENNFREMYNSFWLLDFRNKELLLVGPMVTPNNGGPFDVIWYEDSVIVTFHSVAGTQLGRFDYQPNWGKAERKFVKDVEADTATAADKELTKDEETKEDITLTTLPLMNKDGVFHPGKRNYINMPHDRLLRKGTVIPSTVQIQKSNAKVKNTRNIFPGYYYDYKTKKLTAIAIEED